MKFSSLPTPLELFRQFDAGQISREELQSTMAIHAGELIAEMETNHANPVAAYIEKLRNIAAVRKLSRKHTSALVREVLTALGEIPEFPPAHLLWNASHKQLPQHCFVRTSHEPVFRIPKMEVTPVQVIVYCEYNANQKNETTRETIILQRNHTFKLELHQRERH